MQDLWDLSVLLALLALPAALALLGKLERWASKD